MKKSLTKKAITCFVLFFIAIATFVSGISFNQNVFAQQAILIENEIEEFYQVGEKIEINPAEIEYKGKIYAVMPTITFPDGKNYSLHNVELIEEGLYTLEYSLKVGNEKVKVSKSFTVANDTFTVSNGGKVYFGESKLLEGEGLIVELPEKSVFRYNKIIDLNKSGTMPVIDFDILTQTPPKGEFVGQEDFIDLYVVLTDAHDPKNYVTIKANRSYDEGWSRDYAYIHAGAAFQQLEGWKYGRGDATDEIHLSEDIGTAVYYSFRGNRQQDPYSLRYIMDYANKTVYVSNNGLTNYCVANLDGGFFASNPWSGFTTGEVFLSVYADNYLADCATIRINDLYGEELKVERFIPEVPAPIVELGDYQEDSLPVAVVGHKYPVFPVSFNSQYGNERLSTNVYYGYGSDFAHLEQITDGCFTPKLEGFYTIEYKVTDRYGNENIKLIHVNCIKETTSISVNINNLETIEKSINLGETIQVSNEITVAGGSGIKSLSAIIKNVEDGTIIEIDLENPVVKPLKLGEWQVIYTAVDYIGCEGQQTYDIIVMENTQAVFDGIVPTLPKYIIVNSDNIIPDWPAIDYSGSTTTQLKAKIYAVQGEAERVEVVDNLYRPMQEGEVKIIYEVTSSAGQTTTKELTTYAKDAGFGSNIDMSKYFEPFGKATLEATAKSIVLTGEENGDGAEFIRELIASGFNVRFNIDSAKKAASKINLYITDFEDASKFVKFSIIKSNDSVKLGINDGKEYYLTGGVAFGGNIDFYVTLKGNRLDVTNNIFTVTNFYNGQSFTGFDSGKCYFKVEFEYLESDEGQTAVSFLNINGQPLSNVTQDFIAPTISLKDIKGWQFDQGQVITIPKIDASDVLDGYSEISIKITRPDGQIAKSVDDVLLSNVATDREYKLHLDAVGNYRVVITVSDSAGSETIRFNISSIDYVAPTISIDGTSKTVKVGATVALPEIVVFDDYSKQAEVYICVFVPKSEASIDITESKKFTASVKGTYRVRIVAFDEAGNMSSVDYFVTVK